MKQTLLIIPGFGESANEGPYRELARIYKGEYNVVAHTPKWNYRTATDWLRDFERILEKIDVQTTTVVSFSLGAYIALIAAESYTFKKIILCSLAPFFKEQLDHIPPIAEKILGKQRMIDFSVHKTPKVIQCPAVFLFGSEEWFFAINEAKRLSARYKSEFVLVPHTHHELTTQYLELIGVYLK